MNKSELKITYIFAAFILALMFILSLMGGGVGKAYAAANNYSGVLDDLSKDENFNVAEWFENENDYSIQVIQIAESTDGELFVYTYQPRQKPECLLATEINMSLTDKMGIEVEEDTELSDEDKPKPYGLTLISNDGVFCKYKVNNFTVHKDAVRYYNIASIYRDWIKGVDSETGNDNVINSVSFPVGKLFKAKTENNSVVYSSEYRQVIEIINPYSDYLRYNDGYHWQFITGGNWKYTDVHYIAFDTDLSIDTLMEADVSFYTQSYSGKVPHLSLRGKKTEHEPITVCGEQKGGNAADGWFSTKYEWKRIQRVEDFIKTPYLRDTTIENVKNLKWVLMFYETQATRESGNVQGNWHDNGVLVTDVTVLRLKFRSQGKVYNLGAVSDKVTGDDVPGNKPDSIGFWAYVWRCIVRLFKGTATLMEKVVAIVAIFVLFLALPILLTVLSLIFPAFGAVMKKILKGLWWLISLPFRGIAALVRRIRGE